MSSSSAVPCSSAASSTGSPRPFPLTYHVLVSPRTSLAHVASAQIFRRSLPHHVSVLIRRIRRVAPLPSVTVSTALLFVLTLSALARASPAASSSSRSFCACPLAASRHALITSLLHPLCSSRSCFHVSALRPVSIAVCFSSSARCTSSLRCLSSSFSSFVGASGMFGSCAAMTCAYAFHSTPSDLSIRKFIRIRRPSTNWGSGRRSRDATNSSGLD